MKILSITIEGFKSIIQKTKYKLDRPGINIILGNNGYGKTTIFDALAWALYGQLLKKDSDERPWPIVIGDDFKGTKVCVKCEEGFEVIRCSEYKGKIKGIRGANKIFIIENGELKPIRDKRDNQKYINQKLGYSFELFRSSVLFAQELKRLIQEDGPTKKRVFDEAFESTFILKARQIAEERLDTWKSTYQHNETKHLKYRALKENNESLLKDMLKLKKEFSVKKGAIISLLRKEIKKLKIKLPRLLKSMKGINKQKRVLTELHEKIDELNKAITPDLVEREFRLMLDKTRYGEEMEKIKQKLKKLNGSKNTGKCSECGADLRGKLLKKHNEHFKSEVKELNESLKTSETILLSTTKEHELALKLIEQEKESLNEIKTLKELGAKGSIKLESMKENQAEVKGIKAVVAEKRNSIIREQAKKMPYKTKKIKANIEVFISKVKRYSDNLIDINKKMEVDQWLLDDPLSNSGLKAFIFDSMLNKLNHFLKYYTKFIGFPVRVFMDLKSANKDFCISVSRSGAEVPYWDLSKGEKQLVEVALCFALNDVTTMNKPINILLMDEIFESLSKENIEIVGNIIVQKSLNCSIHLITHQTLFNPTSCYKIFIQKNDKGQTVIHQKYREG